MNKKAIAAAGGAAALAAVFIAAPASAQATATTKEKVVGPSDLIHLTVTGCTINKPFALAGFVDPDGQVWKKLGKGKWAGTVHTVKQWGIFDQHPKAKTSVGVQCAGSSPVDIPIVWDPKVGGDTPQPSKSPLPTSKPTPSAPEKSIKVTVSPQYFHAGDTLHVAVYKCPSKPTVHSQILTGGAAWKHAKGVWKTPVKVANGLREGYYDFTVKCKGFKDVIFKVKYGNPADTSHHPAKHNPGGQTKDIPGGAPETGGGSTAQAFV